MLFRSHALEEELQFSNGIATDVVASIVDHVVVEERSTAESLFLGIYLRFGGVEHATIKRNPFVFWLSSSRSITPKLASKKI